MNNASSEKVHEMNLDEIDFELPTSLSLVTDKHLMHLADSCIFTPIASRPSNYRFHNELGKVSILSPCLQYEPIALHTHVYYRRVASQQSHAYLAGSQ
jgi:hypothetical protein